MYTTSDSNSAMPELHALSNETISSSESSQQGHLDLIVIKKGMNLADQTWKEIWEYMLDEDPEEGEFTFYQYLLDHAGDLIDAEKPYKGNCQLRDVHWLRKDFLLCDMIWEKHKILLFTAENKSHYVRAGLSDWTCVFTEDGEKAAKKLIKLLKEC